VRLSAFVAISTVIGGLAFVQPFQAKTLVATTALALAPQVREHPSTRIPTTDRQQEPLAASQLIATPMAERPAAIEFYCREA
jgi:hypothetical protein